MVAFCSISIPPERWLSGRKQWFAKPPYWLNPVPGVRIPLSPPFFMLHGCTDAERTLRNRGGKTSLQEAILFPVSRSTLFRASGQTGARFSAMPVIPPARPPVVFTAAGFFFFVPEQKPATGTLNRDAL